MFDRTYYATHPDMMECVSNDELRDRYLISELFREGECVLNYPHADRFVIGGVAVGSAPVKLPDQTEPASAAGHPFLERRELAVVNVGKTEGTVTVDGEAFTLEAGDSFAFEATKMHRFWCVGDVQTELIWTVTPAVY